MQPAELAQNVEKCLEKPFSTGAILDRFCFVDEASRTTSSYTDPVYIPAYYHLGKFLQPTKLVELGFNLGLTSSAFCLSCSTLHYILEFQRKTDEYYSPRLGKHNLKKNYKGPVDVYVGEVLDEEFLHKFRANSYGLAIINDEVDYDTYRCYLDLIWSQMEENGIILMDYLTRHDAAKKAFYDFCKSKNRTPVEVHTRYGWGLLER